MPLGQSSNIADLLDRLRPEELFGLLCTTVVMGTIATLLMVLALASVYRRLRQLKMRTDLIADLAAQGRSNEQILELVQLTNKRLPKKFRRSKPARQNAKVARSTNHAWFGSFPFCCTRRRKAEPTELQTNLPVKHALPPKSAI